MSEITIEVWSDIVCPFCYIGKKHLEKALAGFEHKDDVKIIWKSFLLNPQLKTDPEKTIESYLSESKGISIDQVKTMNKRVVEMAENAGLQVNLTGLPVANSMNAHRLLHYGESRHKAGETKERLFRAYFCEGKNIDSKEELLRIAEELNFETESVKQILNNSGYEEEILADYREASELGVRGVPFFVFNRKYAISGAQPVEVFSETLETLIQKEV